MKILVNCHGRLDIMKDIGINLYSLRNLISDETGLLDTVLKLREMGYTNLQYSGGPYDPAVLAKATKESGLPIILTHVPLERILNDTDALMEEHALFGCKNIGLGALGINNLIEEKSRHEIIEKLDTAAERMTENGFSFYYHNHHHEFCRIGSKTILEYMIENAPHINFTFDTYWAQYGGVSILEYIKKLNGRIGCVHLKDYRVNAQITDGKVCAVSPTFAPVGYGNISFKTIVPEMIKSGTKYFIVEQDNAAELPDPLGEVRLSVEYIKNEL